MGKTRGRVYKVITLIFIGLMAGACATESPTEPAPPSPSYNFSIAAHIFPGASVVVLADSTGNPIDTSRAEVYINDSPLLYLYGKYISYSIFYTAGSTYNLKVIVDSDTITASVTTPDLDSLRITQPPESTVFAPETAIPVSWSYYGSIGTGKAFVVMDYEIPDTTTYISGPLDGITTSDTIPPEATSLEGRARISVMGGDLATIPGLLDPDTTDRIDGSYLAAYTLDEVYVEIGGGR